MKTLITGGVKSGKSRYALERARNFSGEKIFLATARAFDPEMKEKIERHRRQRGADFITIEVPVDIDKISGENIILDCITMWMNNLFYDGREDEWEKILDTFLRGLKNNVLIVTNEVGLGNIPYDASARRYNEYLANANRMIAEAMDELIFMVSGFPILVKGKKK